MTPGYYVVRLPKPRGSRRFESCIPDNFVIESRCFPEKRDAVNWREWIASENPRDTVIVMRVEEDSFD
jgi:hypothetical protein